MEGYSNILSVIDTISIEICIFDTSILLLILKNWIKNYSFGEKIYKKSELFRSKNITKMGYFRNTRRGGFEFQKKIKNFLKA